MIAWLYKSLEIAQKDYQCIVVFGKLIDLMQLAYGDTNNMSLFGRWIMILNHGNTYADVAVIDNKIKRRVCLTLSVLLSSAVMVGCSQKTFKHSTQSTMVQNTSAAPMRYQVRAGDTVSKIASRYGLNWRSISALNNLDANHTIYVGQWLMLPQSQSNAETGFAGQLTSQTERTQTNVAQKQMSVGQKTVSSTPSQTLVGSSALMRFGYPVGRTNLVVRQFGTPTNHGLTEGMFFSGRAGDVILASLGGRVARVDIKASRPQVVIEHGDGYTTSYFDVNQVRVREGQMVSKGDQLGQMSAQTSSGMALFEFRLAKDGRFIDPVSVLH